jgi:hypothetical protein
VGMAVGTPAALQAERSFVNLKEVQLIAEARRRLLPFSQFDKVTRGLGLVTEGEYILDDAFLWEKRASEGRVSERRDLRTCTELFLLSVRYPE